MVSSSLLGYDNNTGAVRDSIADVRKKNRVPTSTIPSLQVTKDNEFDRILLLVFHRFLADKGIPEEFLKSNYFTLRPQLLQVYQEDPGFGFRARLEEIIDDVEKQIVRDYKMLVNETNRTYLSRYAFEDMVRTIVPSDRRYSASKTKLEQIKQWSLTIPGATQKFSGLQQLSETYTKTSESKFINVQHFMRGLQEKMINDTDFVNSSPKLRVPGLTYTTKPSFEEIIPRWKDGRQNVLLLGQSNAGKSFFIFIFIFITPCIWRDASVRALIGKDVWCEVYLLTSVLTAWTLACE